MVQMLPDKQIQSFLDALLHIWISFCLKLTFEFLLYNSCYWSNYDLCVMWFVLNISSILKFSSQLT